jgi:hypothetical protein
MKPRLLGAACATVLALALLPGSAMAALPGTVDQSTSPGATSYLSDTVLVQSFTAGRTGALTHIELYCSDDGIPADITLAFSMALTHSGTCGATADWVDFVLPNSYLVAAGNTYDITINTGYVPFRIYGSAADYAGGEATESGGSITGISDFAFRTYVEPIQTMSNTWSPAAVPPGASTPVTLTAQVSFPAVSLSPLVSPVDYQFQMMGYSSWFTPSGISCTGPIDPGDCTLANYIAPGPGIHWQTGGGAATLTVVITGTASPGVEDTVGTAETYSCVLASDGGDPPSVSFGMCDMRVGELAVGNVSPPPTSTPGGSGSSGGGLSWLLPAALAAMAALGSSLLVMRRQAGVARGR